MNKLVCTVFIVDDVREVRTALSRLLVAAGYQTRLFDSAEEFLRDPDAEAPGCLLLDIFMPGLSGLDLQRALIGARCWHPIVFLTGQGDIPTSVHAMKAGAVDFLTKPIDSVRLFGAVDQAFRLDDAERRTCAIRSIIEERLEALTPRERQVMEHVVCGRLNKQIAADLGTGEKTVKVHRGRVMAKMRARSVAELVQLAARVGVAMEPALRVSARLPHWAGQAIRGSLAFSDTAISRKTGGISLRSSVSRPWAGADDRSLS
jgi:FixJ family two-component response regulator